MSGAGRSTAAIFATPHRPLPRSFVMNGLPPALIARDTTIDDADTKRRTRLWEFSTNLHCSIIGTCLSTAELRQTLTKLGAAQPGSTDHDLHSSGVSLAGKHDKAARALHKALDTRHKLALNEFARAQDDGAIGALWRDAVRRGDIPGAYWALLTHAATTQALVRQAFGEVHMLSHLVGAANRADIRRLAQLEQDNAALQARLDRQQLALRDQIVCRDAQIESLRSALAERIVTRPESEPDIDEVAVWQCMVADLQHRSERQMRRVSSLQVRLDAAEAALSAETAARHQADRENAALRAELDAVDQLDGRNDTAAPGSPPCEQTVLYVGGRPGQIAHLRAIAARCGADLLYHDGGVEHHLRLLPGLTSRADVVVFPVDCVSHPAALAVKSYCQQAGKKFVPLRSSGAASLLAALSPRD